MTHAHHRHSKNIPFDAPDRSTDPIRARAASRSTWVSVAVNIVLTLLQIIFGIIGKSQALVADGLHSLSDLLSDFIVLFANRQSSRKADASHPYGHARIETAATLILGSMLMALALLLLWGAGVRLASGQAIATVHYSTLIVAAATLVFKEGLYRYLMGVAKRANSQMLMANAWHSRSDAWSSLVVLVGIGGNLAGFKMLDVIAAIIVAILIGRMGWQLAREALSQLIDKALDEEEVRAIREALLATPGVRGLHELRTRKMGDRALVDAHIMVDAHISVSEGHYIAETARKRILRNSDVLDVMVHVDPEDDLMAKPSVSLPSRPELTEHLHVLLGDLSEDFEKMTFHYLGGRVEADLIMKAELCRDSDSLEVLRGALEKKLSGDPYLRNVTVHCRLCTVTVRPN